MVVVSYRSTVRAPVMLKDAKTPRPRPRPYSEVEVKAKSSRLRPKFC